MSGTAWPSMACRSAKNDRPDPQTLHACRGALLFDKQLSCLLVSASSANTVISTVVERSYEISWTRMKSHINSRIT